MSSQIAHLNDAELWQAARATMPQASRERLEELHDQLQRTGLSAQEEKEEQALLALYRETILVRAQAAVLLKERGYDVSDPIQFQPFEYTSKWKSKFSLRRNRVQGKRYSKRL